MATWYQSNQRLFNQERKALAAACPLLRMAVVGPKFRINSAWELARECALVHGTYNLVVPETGREIGYGIVLLMPPHYPNSPPEMFCNDSKLPIGEIDRHIMSDGRACLGVQGDIITRWSLAPTIVGFLNNFVAPFLAWQAYYEVYHMAPPWGERSHFSQGILEFYAELFGVPNDSCIVRFMQLLARKNRPKGHEPCPCNSGTRLRNCHSHRQALYEIRERLPHHIAEQDLKAHLRGDMSKLPQTRMF